MVLKSLFFSDSKWVLHNNEEFKRKVANPNLSQISEIDDWKKDSQWTGNDSLMKLSRDTYFLDSDFNISIVVIYEINNSNIVGKTIDLLQSGVSLLYYALEENFKPTETPSKYATFEHDDFLGGFAHEMFPLVGFVTPDNQFVDLPMDAGLMVIMMDL